MVDCKFIMIKTTFDSIEEANQIAKMLINKKLVASAQLSKLNVFYVWKNEARNHDEIELSCITQSTLFREVSDFIRERHSYECCQILSIPIMEITEDFGSWIISQTTK